MGKGGFKELRVWRKGKDLAVYVYQIKWDTLYPERNIRKSI